MHHGNYGSKVDKGERVVFMTKVLILGGSGFVGRNVKEYLQKKNTQYEVFAPSSRELNCVDEEAVTEYLRAQRFDFVLNFAVCADGRDAVKGEMKTVESNLRIFLNFAKNEKLFGKMFYSGSGAEYDKRFPIVRVREEQVGKTIPTDSYGLMKYTIGRIIEHSSNIYNLRLFGIYGKYEAWPVKFISLCCCKAVRNIPLSIRQNVYFDYLWVDDFCRMLEYCLTHELSYHTYNMVSGTPVSLSEICDVVKRVSQKELPVYICREGLANEYTASSERFLAENPEFVYTPFEEAVENLYRWYQEREEELDLYKMIYQ